MELFVFKQQEFFRKICKVMCDKTNVWNVLFNESSFLRYILSNFIKQYLKVLMFYCKIVSPSFLVHFEILFRSRSKQEIFLFSKFGKQIVEQVYWQRTSCNFLSRTRVSYYTFKTRNKDHDHKSKPDSQHDVQDSQRSSQWEFPQQQSIVVTIGAVSNSFEFFWLGRRSIE